MVNTIWQFQKQGMNVNQKCFKNVKQEKKKVQQEKEFVNVALCNFMSRQKVYKGTTA